MSKLVVLMLCSLTALVPTASAQEPAAKQPADQAKPAPLPAEKLEQLVAPIALYPDSLLTQVLMASTYPLEVVEAARWVKKNPTATGDALEKALQDQTWDPSVKALCGLPTVLARMNENLDWTQDLGDAFLANQAAVMDAVQTMRRKALEAGNLKTTKEQTVTDQPDKIIVIQAADPQVVYVPTYYPTAVYGVWHYPVYYYPPLYVPPPPGAMMFSFAVGVAWGHALYGDCHWGWGQTTVNINVDKQNNFINRAENPARKAPIENRAKDGSWQHDPQHRKGVRYSDPATAKRFPSTNQGGISREQARGFAPSDRARTGGGRTEPPTGVQRPGVTDRPSTGQRPGPTPKPAARPTPQSSPRSSGLSGASNPGLDRAASQRGHASRGSGGGARPAGGGRRR